MSSATKQATSKLFPGNPSSVMVIRQVSPNITTFSVPFSRFGLAAIGGRGTLARLQSGNLAIFSPVQLSDEVKKKVTEMGGQLSYIIAPDLEHHLHITAWKEAYPSARILAPGGLREKRQKQGNEDIPFDYIFTHKNKTVIELPSDLTETFDVEFFDGHASREIVLYHKADRTVIQADLLFNLPAKEQYSLHTGNDLNNIWSRIFAIVMRTEPGSEKMQQRLMWYAAAKNKQSYAESAKRVAGWDIQRIIPCHGDVMENGNEVFKRMFAWHL